MKRIGRTGAAPLFTTDASSSIFRDLHIDVALVGFTVFKNVALCVSLVFDRNDISDGLDFLMKMTTCNLSSEVSFSKLMMLLVFRESNYLPVCLAELAFIYLGCSRDFSIFFNCPFVIKELGKHSQDSR